MVAPEGVVAFVRFPFSDLSSSKLRPAGTLARAGGVNWIRCQVTSNAYGDPAAIALTPASFLSGGLGGDGFVRPASINRTTQLRGLPLLLPPRALQQEFARRVTAVDKLEAAQHESLAKMDTLFAALQHRAVRGEL